LFTSVMRRPAQIAAIASAVVIVGGTAASAVIFRPAPPAHPATSQLDAARREAAGLPADPLADGASQDNKPTAASAPASRHQAHASSAHAAAPMIRLGTASAGQAAKTHRSKPRPALVYMNPLRRVGGLILERVDMGCDFGGAGPVYAIGDAVITNATAGNGGWPGGGWITYRLTDGPAKGLQVYVAEDVTPTVQVGQQVTPRTVIANMFNGGDGIETGWAMPDGSSAESQLAVAGGISGGGPFPTMVGLDFDRLLHALGVPRAPNFAQSGFGLLPSGYPTSWASLR
jgi:hypothetical protein